MKLVFMPEDELYRRGEREKTEKMVKVQRCVVEKEWVLMIYTAITPNQRRTKRILYVLLESFEGILVVDYHVKLPDVVY